MSERDEVTNLKRQNLAIKAFLNLLDADIRAGRNLQVIPDGLAACRIKLVVARECWFEADFSVI